MAHNKTTLRDIANAAGVSPALVSFVLNGKAGHYRVNKDTAERIRRVAQEMDYHPNIAARFLRMGRTTNIAFVASDIANPFFAQVARAMEDTAMKEGYTVLAVSTDESADKLLHLTRSLINKGVDGFVVVPPAGSRDIIAKLAEDKVPMVLFDRYFPEIDTSYVALDNAKAAHAITETLIARGFKKITLIAYELDLIHMTNRINGYLTAMEEACLESSIHKISQDENCGSLETAIPELVAKGTEAFIFATNMIALKGLSSLKRLGPDVLDRTGLASFDANAVFEFIDRPIHYINQPIEEMARDAVKILIDSIRESKEPIRNLHEGTLITANE